MEIHLAPANQNPDEANFALQWTLDLWEDHLLHISREDWTNFYKRGKTANYDQWVGNGQELVFIGMRGDEVVGAISLVDFDDLEEFRHLTPWIAAFVVNPQLRGAGIGSKMLKLLEEKAKKLGIKVLHLWTEDQSEFYIKRGYEIVAASTFEHLTFDILRKELGAGE